MSTQELVIKADDNLNTGINVKRNPKPHKKTEHSCPGPEQIKARIMSSKPEIFRFFCIRCGQPLETEKNRACQPATCPNCMSTITIPEPLENNS